MGGQLLIVGGDGMVGRALAAAARAQGLPVQCTTRRMSPLARLGWETEERIFLDLEHVPPAWEAPLPEVAYIVAGIVGYKHCEGNPRAHRINVDGTLAVIRLLAARGCFIVFMSSDAAERLHGTAYGQHKALVEVALQMSAPAAIVRAGRIGPEQLPELVALLLRLGAERRPGITHFGE